MQDGSEKVDAEQGPYPQFLLFGDSLTQKSSSQDLGFGFMPALQNGNAHCRMPADDLLSSSARVYQASKYTLLNGPIYSVHSSVGCDQQGLFCMLRQLLPFLSSRPHCV